MHTPCSVRACVCVCVHVSCSVLIPLACYTLIHSQSRQDRSASPPRFPFCLGSDTPSGRDTVDIFDPGVLWPLWSTHECRHGGRSSRPGKRWWCTGTVALSFMTGTKLELNSSLISAKTCSLSFNAVDSSPVALTVGSNSTN